MTTGSAEHGHWLSTRKRGTPLSGRQGGNPRTRNVQGRGTNAEMCDWKSPQLSPADAEQGGHRDGEVTLAHGVCNSPLHTGASRYMLARC